MVRDAYAGIQPGERPSQSYEARWQIDCERRVALAGHRLAALLNIMSSEG